MVENFREVLHVSRGSAGKPAESGAVGKCRRTTAEGVLPPVKTAMAAGILDFAPSRSNGHPRHRGLIIGNRFPARLTMS